MPLNKETTNHKPTMVDMLYNQTKPNQTFSEGIFCAWIKHNKYCYS